MKKIIGLVASFLGVILIAIVLIPNSEAGATVPSESFQIEGSTLVSYAGKDKTVTIPAEVTTIGRSAFENNSTMETVVIPDTVTTIEPYAFWGCSRLKNVTFGDGLYEVADFAFTDCARLCNVSLSNFIRRIGIMSFADCPSLLNIRLTSYLNDIHETAFDGNKYMTIEATEGSYAYEYSLEFAKRQEDMAEVAMPAPDPTPTPMPIPTAMPTPIPGEVLGESHVVGNMAFVFMDNTAPMVGVGEYAPDYDGEGDYNLSSGQILIQDGILKEWSLYGNETLQEVSLPTGTEEIEQFAFARSSLSKIVLPEGLNRIEYASFYHCDNLAEVEIPDTVTYIGEKAFAHTPWLESFYNGANPELGDFLIVGDGILIAYRGKAETVVIPQTVKSIGEEVFLNHTEIVNVVLPESGLITIAGSAFQGCNNLRNM